MTKSEFAVIGDSPEARYAHAMNTVTYVHLHNGESPPRLSFPPFKAILVAEETASSGWRDEVSEWLVRSGCLYFCAWGEDCEAWHDSVDNVNIGEFSGRTMPEDRFIMTTWHENEPLSEALWFVGVVAEHPIVELKCTLILHVALCKRDKELSAEYRIAIDE